MPEKPVEHKVDLGMQVEVELVSRSGGSERLRFTLVTDDQADFHAGFLGVGTPLAKAILGAIAGSEREYVVGDMLRVKVLTVSISDQAQSENVAARREALMRKARSHSDHVNALTFATSVNSKWGDYDIDSLDPKQWETDEKD